MIVAVFSLSGVAERRASTNSGRSFSRRVFGDKWALIKWNKTTSSADEPTRSFCFVLSEFAFFFFSFCFFSCAPRLLKEKLN